jgi:hypothetical protein
MAIRTTGPSTVRTLWHYTVGKKAADHRRAYAQRPAGGRWSTTASRRPPRWLDHRPRRAASAHATPVPEPAADLAFEKAACIDDTPANFCHRSRCRY